MLVLAGEADVTSAARLDEALTTQASGQGVWLTIDATNLRYVDSAWMRTLVVAALAITAWDRTVTLLNPQPPAARPPDLLCVDGMISVRGTPPVRLSQPPAPRAAGGRKGTEHPVRSDQDLCPERAEFHAPHHPPAGPGGPVPPHLTVSTTPDLAATLQDGARHPMGLPGREHPAAAA